jgi:hypothetical protein
MADNSLEITFITIEAQRIMAAASENWSRCGKRNRDDMKSLSGNNVTGIRRLEIGLSVRGVISNPPNQKRIYGRSLMIDYRIEIWV